MLNELGGLAQLVERLLCKQDVSGSSPLTSICGIKDRVRATKLESNTELGSITSAPTIESSLLDLKSSSHLDNCIIINSQVVVMQITDNPNKNHRNL